MTDKNEKEEQNCSEKQAWGKEEFYLTNPEDESWCWTVTQPNIALVSTKKDMCKKTVFADKEVRGKQYTVTEI